MACLAPMIDRSILREVKSGPYMLKAGFQKGSMELRTCPLDVSPLACVSDLPWRLVAAQHPPPYPEALKFHVKCNFMKFQKFQPSPGRTPWPPIHGDCTIFIVFQYPVVAERHSAKRGVNSAVFPLGEGPCRSHRSGATRNVRCLFSVALRVQPAIAGCARSSPAQACRLGLAMRMQAAIARCSRPSLASRPHDTLAAAAASGAKLLHSATAFCTVAVP